MKCLFIYPKPTEKKHFRFGYSINITYLSAILKKTFQSDNYFFDLSCQEIDDGTIVEFINSKSIDFVLVDFDSFSLKRSENIYSGYDLICKIKKSTNANVIAFGYLCATKKEDIPYADFTCKSDPRFNICKIIGNFIGNNNFSDIIRYDDLPLPDRDLLNQIPFYKLNNFSNIIQTSQGCLNNCSFCQRKGRYSQYKTHSLDYIISDFLDLKKRGVKNVWIIYDNFTFDLNRAKNILNALKQFNISDDMHIALSSTVNIDFDLLDLAYDANVKIISFGLENSSEKVLRFYNKNISKEKIIDIITYANTKGIFTVGNFIIGSPIETVEMILENFDFISSLHLDQINIKILDYMIGSALFDSLPKEMQREKDHYFSCKENGLSDISISTLTELKRNYLSSYYANKESNLRKKVLKFGIPYLPIKEID